VIALQRLAPPVLALFLLMNPAAGTPTPTPRATSTGPATARPTTASTPVPTTAAVAATGDAAPPWSGLPARTYANLKTHILGDPVNIAIEGTRSSILAAFARIGWRRADPLSPRDDARLALAAVGRRSYPTAPVSHLYLFGRAEDVAVEHELGAVSRRDHARFWDTTRRDPKTGLDLYIGDASQDVAVKVLRDKKGLPSGTTHRINGNVDAERNTIVGLLRKAGLVKALVPEPGMGRTTNAVNGGGDRFYTDGRASVVVLTGA